MHAHTCQKCIYFLKKGMKAQKESDKTEDQRRRPNRCHKMLQDKQPEIRQGQTNMCLGIQIQHGQHQGQMTLWQCYWILLRKDGKVLFLPVAEAFLLENQGRRGCWKCVEISTQVWKCPLAAEGRNPTEASGALSRMQEVTEWPLRRQKGPPPPSPRASVGCSPM